MGWSGWKIYCRVRMLRLIFDIVCRFFNACIAAAYREGESMRWEHDADEQASTLSRWVGREKRGEKNSYASFSIVAVDIETFSQHSLILLACDSCSCSVSSPSVEFAISHHLGAQCLRGTQSSYFSSYPQCSFISHLTTAPHTHQLINSTHNVQPPSSLLIFDLCRCSSFLIPLLTARHWASVPSSMSGFGLKTSRSFLLSGTRILRLSHLCLFTVFYFRIRFTLLYSPAIELGVLWGLEIHSKKRDES